MFTLLIYGRLGQKLLAHLRALFALDEEYPGPPVFYVQNREDFLQVLKEENCTFARVALIRFDQRDSTPEPVVYVEATAYTGVRGEVAYLVEPGIPLPINASARERWYAELQVRTLGRFLSENGISTCVNNEFGCALDSLN